MIMLSVALGAAVGAQAWRLTDRAIQARHDSVFPWGTPAVPRGREPAGARP